MADNELKKTADGAGIVPEKVKSNEQKVMMILDMLIQDPECPPQQLRAYAQQLRKGMLYICRFLRDMEAKSRPESLTQEAEVCDTAQLLRGICRQAAPMVEHCGCTLTLKLPEVPVRVLIPQSSAQQLLGCFIANAVNASAVGSTVTVFAENTEKGVRIGVRDAGCGMGEEKLAALLSGSGDAESRGLANCRRILEGMGSALGGESTPGRGSSFFFELPVCPDTRSLASPSAGARLRFTPGLSPLELELSALDERPAARAEGKEREK